MTDVLGNTAGYIDSELSDYEENYGESPNSNYYHLNEKGNNSFYAKNNNYNYKSYSTNERVSPLGVNRNDVITDKLTKYQKCVTNYQQKSPRFGREDLSGNWFQNGTNYQKLDQEYLYNRNSMDTVDSLTPLSNNFEKSFKWWRDDEYNNLESENNTELENTEPVSTPEKEVEEQPEDPKKQEPDANIEWQSWTRDNGDLLELRSKLMNKLLNLKKAETDSLPDNSQNALEDDNSWNELQFYKDLNKLLVDKLLYLLTHNNYNLVYDLNQQYVTSIQNHLVKVHQFINTNFKSHLTHNNNNCNNCYNNKDCNNDLKDFNSNNNCNNGNNDLKDNNNNNTNNNNYSNELKENNNELKDNNKNNGLKEKSDLETMVALGEEGVGDLSEFERLKLENKELRERLEQLESNSAVLKPENDSEKTNESNLLEKLKLVEESKNVLEEDFKKTLVYMRLMKDRLKLFKYNNLNTNFNNRTCNNSLNSHTNAHYHNQSNYSNNLTHNNNNLTYNYNNNLNHNNNLTNNNLSQNNLTNNNLKYNNLTNNNWNPNKLNPSFQGSSVGALQNGNVATTVGKLPSKRSNSCVRFKDTSELYVVPRSMSESRGFVTNSNEGKLSKLFRIFSKSS